MTTLQQALSDACSAVGVEMPRRRLMPGKWVRSDTKGRHGKDDASILIFDDQCGGIVWNHQTAISHRFRVDGANDNRPADPMIEIRRRERDAERETERRHVERMRPPWIHDVFGVTAQKP